MKEFLLSILSKILSPRIYLWLRYRLDKYLGWKGIDPQKILHFYWRNPEVDGGANSPENYLPNQKNRYTSLLLVETISRYVDKDSSIIELGCNVGRNLKFLKDTALFHSSIEDFFINYPLKKFDLVFTSAVLEHLSKESEWVFDRIAESAQRFILTLEIEDFRVNFHRIVGREYAPIFGKRGFRCVEEKIFDNHSPLEGYTLRVFSKSPTLSAKIHP